MGSRRDCQRTPARNAFAGRNPIGGRIGFGSNPNTPTPIEIVGVVRDSRNTGVRDDVRPGLFFPFLETTSGGGARCMRGRHSRPMRCSRP